MKSVLLVLGLCFCSAVCAQQPMETSVSVVTYLEADSAELVKQPSSVLIVSEGLKAGQSYAAKLKVTNQDYQFIEVYPEKTPFPPLVIEPFKPGEYLIPGKRGDKFNVSVRSATSRPIWLAVVIEPETGGPISPDLPPSGFDSVEQVSKSESLKTRDKATAIELAKAWQAVITQTSVDKPLEEAVLAAKKAREAVLLNRKGDVNWNGYLVAVDAEIGKLKIVDTKTYLQALAASVKGLNSSVVILESGQRISGQK